MKFKLSNNKGYSLIELFIVIVIIIMLVALLLGSYSMVENAKTLVLIDEYRIYTKSIEDFKEVHRRLPGDLNRSRKIGHASGQKYTDNSYSGNYVSSNKEYGIPSDRIAPFVELFLNNYIDFEPKKTKSADGILDWNNGGSPISKAFSEFSMQFQYKTEALSNAYSTPIELKGHHGNIFIHHYKDNPLKSNISAKIIKNLDKKLDDGLAFKGNIRATCSSNEYDIAIDNRIKCSSINYSIDSN